MREGIVCCYATWFWVVTDKFIPESPGISGIEDFGRPDPTSSQEEYVQKYQMTSPPTFFLQGSPQLFNSISSLPELMQTSRIFSPNFYSYPIPYSDSTQQPRWSLYIQIQKHLPVIQNSSRAPYTFLTTSIPRFSMYVLEIDWCYHFWYHEKKIQKWMKT